MSTLNRILKALEVPAVIGLFVVMPVLAVVGGAALACAAVAAAVGTVGTAGYVGAAVAGAYLGFVAGYTAMVQSPIRMMGAAPRGPVAKDISHAAQWPFKAAAKFFPGLSKRFNAAAGRVLSKGAAPGASPSLPPPPDEQAKPDAPKAP